MQTNKNTKGRAIFSGEEDVKEKSLKLYTYLVCHANLRNQPNAFGDNVRIFQQRDIVLTTLKRILRLDERTIKKYWEQLELAGYIKFCPWAKGWQEDLDLSFNERWKIRNKHKDTYYEIPVRKDMLFRKIPKETLIELNEYYKVNELVMKIYITLVNYQEECIVNGYEYKRFTYQALREILGYKKETATNRKMEACLLVLSSLNLIDIDMGEYTNEYGFKIPVFILNQANFYIDYDFKGFKTGEINVIPEEIKEKLIKDNKEKYPEAF